MGRPPAGEVPRSPDRSVSVDIRRPIERRGPFEILEKKEIHDRFRMEATSRIVRTPDGNVREILPVSFPGKATLMAVAINGSLIGNREYVYGTDQKNFEFSGGVKGEGTAEQAAIRKVEEEIGVTPRASTVKRLITVRTDSPFLWNKTYQSVADVEAIGEAPRHQTIERELIPAENIRSMVLSGEINTANIALQALLIAEYLEEQGRELPQVETRIMPGGDWMNKKPAPWKLHELRPNEDGTPLTKPDGTNLTRGGYDVLSRTVKYETETGDAQLIHDRIKKADGTPGDQFFLTYPRQLQMVMIDENDNVYLKPEFSYAYGEIVPALPGTAIMENETYGEATQRLAEQELGVKETHRAFYDLGERGETTSRMDYRSRIIAARVKRDELDGREDIVRYSVDEGWDAVRTGAIDMLTPALTFGLLKHSNLAPAA